MADTSPPAASPATSLPPLPALDNTYGAMFIGTCLGLILYGLTVHQTYRYFRMYPKDALWLKGLVIATVAIETFHSLICMVSVYHYLVTNFFHPENLEAGTWSTRLLTPITGISIVLCQSFYALRVYLIGPQRIYRWLVIVGVLCMMTAFGFTSTATYFSYRVSLAEFGRYTWMISGFFGFAIVADACLTGTLVTVLLHRRTGFKSTDSLIETLIIYAINTGLLTSLLGIPCFVFAITLPGNLIYLALSIVGVKLYANSVLAVLNSRRALSDRMNQSENLEMLSFEPHSTGRIPERPPQQHAHGWRISQMPPVSSRTNPTLVFAELQSTTGTLDGAAELDKREDDKGDAMSFGA